MEYRKLGRTDMDVSVVALGCWALAGGFNWGPQDEADSVAAVHAALDADINFFDTAEGYGEGSTSEKILGKALPARRHDFVIATKVSSTHLVPADVHKACDASLKRLRTDIIDLYQIHWPSRTVPLADTLGALDELKDAGKIRAFGVSNFGPQDLGELLAISRPETNQLPYNLLWRAIEHDVQAMCAGNGTENENETGIGIICYSPILQGLLLGKFNSADEVPADRARTKHFSKDRPQTRHGQSGREEETFAVVRAIGKIAQRVGLPMGDVALAWVLAQKGVTSVLAGARNPEQVKQNARAADVQLGADVLDDLNAATEGLKTAFGANADMWASRYR